MTTFTNVLRKRLVIELIVTPQSTGLLSDQAFLETYLLRLSKEAQMTIVFGPLVHNWAEQLDSDKYAGLEGVMIWAESGVQLYTWEKHRAVTIDLYTCKNFHIPDIIEFTQNYFDTERVEWTEIHPLITPRFPENEYLEVRETKSKGLGLFLKKDVFKNTVLASFDGEIHYAQKTKDLSLPTRNQAIQCAEYFYRNSTLLKYINHSCNPNCGVHGLFDIVARSDLKAGTEITFDYTMTEDSDWEIPGSTCNCGENSCRGKVGPYRNLPLEKKIEYWDYTSNWLKEKYGYPN